MQVRPSGMEMDLIYGELDADNDGVVELKEFLLFMTQPGVQSANGAKLLSAFRHLEAFQHQRGVNHPPQAGRSGKFGQLHLSDLSLAMRTYLPDKVRSEREAAELLHSVKPDKRTGMVDYHAFVRAHVKPETMPPLDEDGRTYNIPHERKTRRHTAMRLPELGEIEAADAAASSAAAAAAAVAASDVAAAAASRVTFEDATRLLHSPHSDSSDSSGGGGGYAAGSATAGALAAMIADHSAQVTEREALAACDPDSPVSVPVPSPVAKKSTGKKKNTLHPKSAKPKQPAAASAAAKR
jgi:Ca2+-binding EF-hand superfamily protein